MPTDSVVIGKHNEWFYSWHAKAMFYTKEKLVSFAEVTSK